MREEPGGVRRRETICGVERGGGWGWGRSGGRGQTHSSSPRRTHTHTHTRTQTHTRTHLHVHPNTHTHTHTHKSRQTHTHTHTQTHTHTHTHTHLKQTLQSLGDLDAGRSQAPPWTGQHAEGESSTLLLLQSWALAEFFNFNSILCLNSHRAIQLFSVFQVVYVINILQKINFCFHQIIHDSVFINMHALWK